MHRVVGLGILYFAFASIEGVLRITGVSCILLIKSNYTIFFSICCTVKQVQKKQQQLDK